MFYNIKLGAEALSSFKKYQIKNNNKSSNSIIEFKANKSHKTEGIIPYCSDFYENTLNFFDDELSFDDDSNSEVEQYPNGAVKKITRYDDGSYDEIYKTKNGLSYMKIKRFENKNSYTEIYRDSSGFCGKETFSILDDGTSISLNEFSNGKKYTETYKKTPDGGFERKLENSDGTGYLEIKKFNIDGTTSYSIQNFDGSGNTIVYRPDGSYKEILIDSKGNKTETEYK